MTDGENGPSQIHCTWQTLPKANVTIASIRLETEYILLDDTVEIYETWKEL